jgi:hypothetical protein
MRLGSPGLMRYCGACPQAVDNFLWSSNPIGGRGRGPGAGAGGPVPGWWRNPDPSPPWFVDFDGVQIVGRTGPGDRWGPP